MYYVYRTTNLVNGKTYIGQHKSKDVMNDLYLGSGKLLKMSIEKYGKENHSLMKQRKECQSLKRGGYLGIRD